MLLGVLDSSVYFTYPCLILDARSLVWHLDFILGVKLNT